MGAIVYQVFPDRFVPPSDTPAGAKYKSWEELPKASKYDEKSKGYPHCYDLWGGTLDGIRSKLGYIKSLGADVLYLTPIFQSPSNHKYDTEDYFKIDSQFGTMKTFDALLRGVHKSEMKLMLDGVFNHIGSSSSVFKSPRNRDWFYFDKAYPTGYRGYAGVASMPALRLENKKVQDYIWAKKSSVVQTYLDKGIDGWRLDVAFELGPKLLEQLTTSAHKAKPGSAVVGEISGYPAEWSRAVDGVFNFTSLNLALQMLTGNIRGGQVGLAYTQMVQDAGIESLLKSWLLTDNHDTPRFASMVPEQALRNLLFTLQFTLPGSPCIYYGTELGMTGSGDPENRAPMRWDLAQKGNPNLDQIKLLTKLRKQHPALRYGDYKSLATDKLLGLVRHTDRVDQTVFVIMNPTSETVREAFPNRTGKLMSWGMVKDQLTGKTLRSITGLMEVELKPKSVMILTPVLESSGGYSPYDRVKI